MLQGLGFSGFNLTPSLDLSLSLRACRDYCDSMGQPALLQGFGVGQHGRVEDRLKSRIDDRVQSSPSLKPEDLKIKVVSAGRHAKGKTSG